MNTPRSAHGVIALFGSGEMSPTGRKIHEALFKRQGIESPAKIGILETPTGFEVNAIHAWPERMESFFSRGLANFHPDITRIRAWRRDGKYSTDDPRIVDVMSTLDYLYCGAGSPGYTVKHLAGTRAEKNMHALIKAGKTVCLGSASAMAIGSQVLPVYEIFKVGEDVHWIRGLGMLEQYGITVAIIPHWNNQEGDDFDTTRCYMGIERFSRLESMLERSVVILGIDEHTACILDIVKGECAVMGVGSVHVRGNGHKKTFESGTTFSVRELMLT